MYLTSGIEWVQGTRQGARQPQQPEDGVWGHAGQPFARVQGSRAIHHALGEEDGENEGKSRLFVALHLQSQQL